jgi:NAD(P)-dependent dehydrogenase (short-subunit alcohol dehydrogenase family)
MQLTREGRLAGKIALITGAARGIGAAGARLFAAEGAEVAVADVLDDLAREVAEEINAQGGRALSYHHDISDESSWGSLSDRLVADFGGLDILVNNAGITGSYADLSGTSLDDWNTVLAVNQTGSFLGGSGEERSDELCT